MKLEQDDHIIGVWVAQDKVHNNFLMMLLRRDDQYICNYRFRYVRDDKIFDCNDERSCYGVTISATESKTEVLSKLHSIFDVIKTHYPSAEYFQIEGSFSDFIDFARNHDLLFHVRKLPLDESQEKE